MASGLIYVCAAPRAPSLLNETRADLHFPPRVGQIFRALDALIGGTIIHGVLLGFARLYGRGDAHNGVSYMLSVPHPPTAGWANYNLPTTSAPNASDTREGRRPVNDRMAVCIAALPIVSALVGGCQKSTAPTELSLPIIVTGAPLESHAPKVSALDGEAGREATRYWKLKRAGESYYVLRSDGKMKRLYELRNITILVIKEGISDADKLNAIEWHGYIDLKCAYRSQESAVPQLPTAQGAQQPRRETWSEWRDSEDFGFRDHFTLTARRTAGRWEMSASGRTTYEEISASELPR